MRVCSSTSPEDSVAPFALLSDRLRAQGYAEATIRRDVKWLRRVARWLAGRGHGLSSIPCSEIDQVIKQMWCGQSKGWIATVTRNQRVDRYRRSSQQRNTDSIDEGWDQSETLVLAQRIADSRPTPDAVAVSHQVGEIVSKAVAKVSPEMREVVKMRFVYEMDNQEIAHRLRIPECTVKSRTNRGRAQLAHLLSPMRAAMGTI